jgi:hypothetical protein
MKRVIMLVLALLLAAATSLAQEKKAEDDSHLAQMRSKVFEVHNRSPRGISDAVALLLSGVSGAGISWNPDLHTITVRDFPENIATIEGAINRLDKQAAESPGIELKISVLIGAKTPLNGEPIPDDLGPVVKQLRSTLRYSNYCLMAAVVQRATTTDGIVEGSGVAEPAILGLPATERIPLTYYYRLHTISLRSAQDRPSIDVAEFDFSMSYPVKPDGPVQSVGFKTPVSLRPSEKVVIGTSTMGDKALIVVVTAAIEPKGAAAQ